MVAQQGDVVWVRFPRARGSGPAGKRPAVVIQHDRFNRTAINTVVVVAITSQLKYAELPGNVRLRRGEGGLPKSSVVNVTQIATIDLDDVDGKLGTLSKGRILSVWDGVRLVLDPSR